jgi:hypothetical protein
MARMLLADESALRVRVQRMVDESLGQVMAAVNGARDGHLIDDSEVAVNDILNDLKRRVYQEALQARLDAAEASFSPRDEATGRRLASKGRSSVSRLTLPGRVALTALRARGAQERIALIDGAPWIASQTRRRQPTFTAVTLDFWHLSEHVHGMRREVFGEADEPGRAWTDDLLATLRDRGYDPFWQELVQLRSRHRRRRAREAIDQLMHYVAPRRDMLDYRRHDQHGWDVGSGPTESMCKALTRRVKGGKRWNPDHAQAMIGLEALHQSNLWSTWWAKRLQHDL